MTEPDHRQSGPTDYCSDCCRERQKRRIGGEEAKAQDDEEGEALG